MQKSTTLAVVIALVGALILDVGIGASGKKLFGGTVENFPVLFQNGLQTGLNPLQTASDSLIRIANRITSGSSSGTYIGVNEPSGSTADFANFQNNGTVEFRVTSTGATTIAGALAPASVTVGSGGLDTTAAGALNLGPTTATSVVIGGTAVTDISTTGTTAATLELGITTGTGTMTLGQSTASNEIDIGNAAIATGNTQTIKLGAGAASSTGLDAITIGSTNGASSLALKLGTGNYVLTGAAGSTVTVGTGITSGALTEGAALTTGTITMGGTATTGALTFGRYSGASASSISIGGGATTGAETLHFGDGAATTGSAIITIGSNVTTVGSGVKIVGDVTQFHQATAVSVSSSTVITAAQLLNAGIILHPSTDNNARTFTLDTGANIAAAMPGGTAAAGDTFSFEVANGVNTLTVAADASSSFFTGTGTMAVGTTRIFNCEFTSSSVYVCY